MSGRSTIHKLESLAYVQRHITVHLCWVEGARAIIIAIPVDFCVPPQRVGFFRCALSCMLDFEVQTKMTVSTQISVGAFVYSQSLQKQCASHRERRKNTRVCQPGREMIKTYWKTIILVVVLHIRIFWWKYTYSGGEGGSHHPKISLHWMSRRMKIFLITLYNRTEVCLTNEKRNTMWTLISTNSTPRELRHSLSLRQAKKVGHGSKSVSDLGHIALWLHAERLGLHQPSTLTAPTSPICTSRVFSSTNATSNNDSSSIVSLSSFPLCPLSSFKLVMSAAHRSLCSSTSESSL